MNTPELRITSRRTSSQAHYDNLQLPLHCRDDKTLRSISIVSDDTYDRLAAVSRNEWHPSPLSLHPRPTLSPTVTGHGSSLRYAVPVAMYQSRQRANFDYSRTVNYVTFPLFPSATYPSTLRPLLVAVGRPSTMTRCYTLSTRPLRSWRCERVKARR